MRHLAAYLLCVVGGNASPSADDITSVITACGGEADEAQITALLGDMEGKDLAEIMQKGQDKLKSCVSAAAAAPAGAAPAGAAPAAAPAAAKPVEEVVDALEGGMDMFGGGGGGGDY